jgi:hypothetical protein
LALGLAFILACRKPDPVYPFEQENVPVEGLTPEQDSIMASLPAKSFLPSEILLDNGETVEQFLQRTNPNSLLTWGQRISSTRRVTAIDKKFQFVSGIFSAGFKLTDTLVHPFTMGPDLNPTTGTGNRPGQFGYAYVYGSRDLNDRHQAGECDLWLYGLDCSGMVSLMLQGGGLKISPYDFSADGLSKEYNLNTLLLNSPDLKDFGYEYEERPQSFLPKVTGGDIIYFRSEGYIGHVGIAIEQAVIPTTQKVMYIYQSNGARKRFPDRGPGCDVYENRRGRGPRCVPLEAFVGKADFSNYGILHLTEKKPVPSELMGDWYLTSQLAAVLVGGKRVKIVPKTFTNIKFTFNIDNTYFIQAEDKDDPGNPYSCNGTFVIYNNNHNINLAGNCIYEKKQIGAEILELTSNSFQLKLLVQKSRSVTQEIILNLHK